MKKFLSCLVILGFAGLSPAELPRERIPGTGELLTAMNKLAVLGSVLYIAAHPDDENTAALALFSKGRYYRTAYLSLTRGDGGQNLIGPEKGAEIGILRTQELLSARRIDGAEQYFTRAVDFGYSKTSEETLEIWNGEEVLGDIVMVMRRFRPDIVITRFPVDGFSGHGHHTACGYLVKEAFQAASDPARFPEQLKSVAPWRPTRLLWNTRRSAQNPEPGMVTVDAGEYNPLLGLSYTEMAAESRSMHKSQGFGSTGRRGAQWEAFLHAEGIPARDDLFDDVDSTWNRIPGGGIIGSRLEDVLQAFDPQNPSRSIPRLLDVLTILNGLESSTWTEIKKSELLDVIQACSGLWLEAVADDFAASPGDDIIVRITAVNRSDFPFRMQNIHLAGLAPDVSLNVPLTNNVPESVEQAIRIPDTFPLSQPFWLKTPPSPGLFFVENPENIGPAENPPSLLVRLTLSAGDLHLDYDLPLIFRWTDRAAGELYRPFEVRPRVTLNPESRIVLFADSRPKEISVKVKSHSPDVRGILRLRGPADWSITPESQPFILDSKYAETQITFSITPPAAASEALISVEAGVENRTHNLAVTEIIYPHIKQQAYFPPSRFQAIRLDIRHAGQRVGYIMGAGDELPDALRAVGYEVIDLTDEMLEKEDLSGFDAVITGIRAYNTRDRLRHAQPRLLEFVERGGTLIVQYNVFRGLVTPNIGPFPLTIGRERVTLETAPVHILLPDHPLLRWPNPIVPQDFNGWVQERGLYFASQWDPRYEALISSRDPGEPDQKGGLLYARYGKGIFIYTGLAWFRQLPAGVPGAFRLFVNLVSSGKAHVP